MDANVALDSMKSLKTIMSSEDFSEFIKSQDSESLRSFSEVQEFLKAEGYEDPEEEKEEKEEKEEPEEKVTKDDQEENVATQEIKKSLSGLEDRFNEESKMLKSIPTLLQGQEELQKSVSELIGVVQKISGMPIGTKAVRTGSANFFEKSFGGQEEDGDGVKLLSVTSQKDKVLDALEKGMSASTDEELTKSYEDSILRYNAGGGMINQSVAIDLYKNHKVRLQR